MLRELKKTRQVQGEPCRRWFISKDIDLLVWQDAHGDLVGFQLAYDKGANEHSFSWHQQRGYAHYVVDDGESKVGKNNAPLLYVNGPLQHQRVLDMFHAVAADVPEEIVVMVDAKLRDYLQNG